MTDLAREKLRAAFDSQAGGLRRRSEAPTDSWVALVEFFGFYTNAIFQLFSSLVS